MSDIIDKIMGTGLMREMTEDLTKDEKESLDVWIKRNIGSLESVSQIIKDLSSTESSSDSFADAINYIFSDEGTKEFEEWLEKNSETS